MYIEVPSTDDVKLLNPCHDRFMCQHEMIYSTQALLSFAAKLKLRVIDHSVYISVRQRYNSRILMCNN
jgi:hypothetical protein